MLFFYYLFFINFLSFAITAYDKQLAISRKNRIPERTLLSLIFIGGTIGCGLAMLFFKHKTSKESYLLKFWGIVILQFIILFGLFYFRTLKV